MLPTRKGAETFLAAELFICCPEFFLNILRIFAKGRAGAQYFSEGCLQDPYGANRYSYSEQSVNPITSLMVVHCCGLIPVEEHFNCVQNTELQFSYLLAGRTYTDKWLSQKGSEGIECLDILLISLQCIDDRLAEIMFDEIALQLATHCKEFGIAGEVLNSYVSPVASVEHPPCTFGQLILFVSMHWNNSCRKGFKRSGHTAISLLIGNAWRRCSNLLENCIMILRGLLWCLWFVREYNEDCCFTKQPLHESKQAFDTMCMFY